MSYKVHIKKVYLLLDTKSKTDPILLYSSFNH